MVSIEMPTRRWQELEKAMTAYFTNLPMTAFINLINCYKRGLNRMRLVC